MTTETVDRGDDFTPTIDPDKPAGLKAGATDDHDDAGEAAAARLEAEIEADKAKGKDGESKPKDTRIPLNRHKEILDRERERREALEVELAKYRQGGQIADVNAEITAAETQLLEMEKQYAKSLTDGEIDKAAELMSKIRRTERGISEKNNQMQLAAAEARAVERARYDITAERLEEQFPQLRPDHADFDKAKVGEILELKEAYQSRGYTPSAALQKAVKLLMPASTKAQERALTTEARVDPKDVEAARRAAAREKAVDTIERTPASASRVGEDSDRRGGEAISAKDVMKMDYKSFSGLNEETLARLRGDTV